MSNYKITFDIDYLEHHGIKDQKWGVQNGPPYPLDSSISTGSRLKIKKKKKTVLNTDVKDLANQHKINKIKKQQQEEARKLKVEKAKTKLAETQQKVSEEQKKNTPAPENKPQNQQNSTTSNQSKQEERPKTTAEKYGNLDANSVKTILKNDASKLTNDELNYLNNRLNSLNMAANLTRDPSTLERLGKAKQTAETILNAASTATRIYDMGSKVYNKLSGKPQYKTRSYEDLLKNFENLSTSELEEAFKRLDKMEKLKNKTS